jgi:hypothetical protein
MLAAMLPSAFAYQHVMKLTPHYEATVEASTGVVTSNLAAPIEEVAGARRGLGS